ncbi:hypothetical protein PF011_g28088 [Phytophthora fragariae]|uniref:Histone-lysine N-methyltransferase, H3 lysine-79 specific n=1 Tax=Phytophthora fragariae TaxID=53985 RepID=A0A6A3HA72_9STRA|nr:hypothetical protein PF011_g28088 [Phytophthora fragariae]
MRTKFLDWEDKQIVQIALEFENEGIRATGDYVARRMDKSKRTTRELSGCPPGRRLLSSGCSPSATTPHRQPSPPPRQARASRVQQSRRGISTPSAVEMLAPAVAELSTDTMAKSLIGAVANQSPRSMTKEQEGANVKVSTGATTEEMMRTVTKLSPRATAEKLVVAEVEPSDGSAIQQSMSDEALLTVPAAIRVLVSLFSEITANDIRQKSGRRENNAGELLPSGVADMLAAMEPLDERDVFLDVGAGIGNVLVQVALTTKVSRCIGVEVRGELCSLATRHIQRHAHAYPLLRKVHLMAADVRDVLLSIQAPTSDATVIFANYFLFEETAKLVFEVPSTVLRSLED